MEVVKCIRIDEHSRVPKYKQIIDSIIQNIANGNLRIDEKIPSINTFSEQHLLSRDTVEKAYHILKERNIITSIIGKGYYISRTKLIAKINVLFLINKLSTYKMSIYNSFINASGANCHTDLHIYHCDNGLFLNLIEKNINAYDYYIVMPHFKGADNKHISYTDEIISALERIPKDKLVIMDNNKLKVKGDIVEIYQDFENDIYNALKQGLSKVVLYSKLVLIFPEDGIYPYPRRILHGFKKFCLEYSIHFEVLSHVDDNMTLNKGELYITVAEDDLVNFIHQVRKLGYVLGKDIGVISYNDTPLKELLGISVMTTDFKAMGETAARMLLNHEKGTVKNPFNFIDRNSL
tara:strand:+ start:1036 stop:2082 length:1047 start_codon:yes stop_codon:yes gene_type:complete